MVCLVNRRNSVSVKVSLSQTPSQSNQNETLPVTTLINLIVTKKYQVTVTWPEVSKLSTTIVPATCNLVTPVLGWTVNTGDKV